VNTGGVNEHDLRLGAAFACRQVDDSLDAVARGLRLVGHDRQLLAGKGIQQRGLARVGPAENGGETAFHSC
jgi:hypothetical protein